MTRIDLFGNLLEITYSQHASAIFDSLIIYTRTPPTSKAHVLKKKENGRTCKSNGEQGKQRKKGLSNQQEARF